MSSSSCSSSSLVSSSFLSRVSVVPVMMSCFDGVLRNRGDRVVGRAGCWSLLLTRPLSVATHFLVARQRSSWCLAIILACLHGLQLVFWIVF